MEKKYTAKEFVEMAKKLEQIFNDFTTYAHFSTGFERVKNGEKLLKSIEDYKRYIPEEVRKYLDNDCEYPVGKINDLEKSVIDSIKLHKRMDSRRKKSNKKPRDIGIGGFTDGLDHDIGLF